MPALSHPADTAGILEAILAGYVALPGKLACQSCIEEATREKEAEVTEVTVLIKEPRKPLLEASAPDLDKVAPSTSSGDQPPQV